MNVKEYREKLEQSGGAAAYAMMEPSLEIWSNAACMGYMIQAAKATGVSTGKIRQMVQELRWRFDEVTLAEAEETYYSSRWICRPTGARGKRL